MLLPSVIHPKKFSINGMLFEIVAYSQLTDEQAAKAAMRYFRSHTFLKKDRGKSFQVLTQFDENSRGLL